MFTRSTLTVLAVMAASSANAESVLPYPFAPFPGESAEAEMANDAHPIVRFLAMCDQFGLDCAVPDLEIDPEAAETRLSAFLEAWDMYIAELGIEMPRPLPFPFGDRALPWPDGGDTAWMFQAPTPPHPFFRNPFAANPFPTPPFGQHDLPVLPRIEIPEGGLPDLPPLSFPWIPL